MIQTGNPGDTNGWNTFENILGLANRYIFSSTGWEEKIEDNPVSKTDQRGRVGGWGTHFSQQAHQNCITCGTMLTENQETGKSLLRHHGCKKVTENQVGREEQ